MPYAKQHSMIGHSWNRTATDRLYIYCFTRPAAREHMLQIRCTICCSVMSTALCCPIPCTAICPVPVKCHYCTKASTVYKCLHQKNVISATFTLSWQISFTDIINFSLVMLNTFHYDLFCTRKNWASHESLSNCTRTLSHSLLQAGPSFCHISRNILNWGESDRFCSVDDHYVHLGLLLSTTYSFICTSFDLLFCFTLKPNQTTLSFGTVKNQSHSNWVFSVRQFV